MDYLGHLLESASARSITGASPTVDVASATTRRAPGPMVDLAVTPTLDLINGATKRARPRWLCPLFFVLLPVPRASACGSVVAAKAKARAKALKAWAFDREPLGRIAAKEPPLVGA